jgi:26S proteasome regulatory subunit N7
MVPFYLQVCERLQWPVDQAFVDKMKKDNEAKLVQLDATIKDATENLGESEVREAFLAKAVFYARIGDKVHLTYDFKF